ncbi:MAG: 2Fe-2S iron-sulfur cluster-binding protein [Cyanobacteria bacterium J06643_5]
MSIYRVRLINQDIGLDRIIEVPRNEYILDIAEDENIRLPSGCKQGNCSACVAKIISGEVDQSEQKFLQNNEIKAGYTITCVAYPLSDCILETHQEQVLYNSSLYFKSNNSK